MGWRGDKRGAGPDNCAMSDTPTSLFPAMNARSRCLVACLLLAVGSAAQAADTCEDLRTRIEANIASKGVTDFSVTVVDVAAEVPGEVVGSCGQGEKKIVYARGVASGSSASAMPALAPAPAPASAPATKAPAAGASQGILTECKDGTVSMGGDCKN
jgi:hypothetical protein